MQDLGVWHLGVWHTTWEYASPGSMALLPPLEKCLRGLVTSRLWMDEVTTVGRDGHHFDLDRAGKLMHAVEADAAVSAVAGSSKGPEGPQIAKVLDNFFGQLEARFVDGRTVDARPRAKELQQRISAVLDSLAVATAAEPTGTDRDHATSATLRRTPTQARRAEIDMPTMLEENEAKVKCLCREVQALAAERETVLEALKGDEEILMGTSSPLSR